jgi:hypothetical protein
MHTVCGLILLSGLYPLWRAWRASRQTPLRHALLWALAAWAAWLPVVAIGTPAGTLTRYLALSLTGCAGVAVLGARRPGVGAWNFVVAGLLAVLLLPVAEGFGEPRLQPAHLLFLAATLAVTLLNYLPTRFAPAALLFGLACGIELAVLARVEMPGWLTDTVDVLAALSPWAALAVSRRANTELSEPDRLWLEFRDRFGGLWGLRQQDQFNRAAANAGWPVALSWGGLRRSEDGKPPEEAELMEMLRAVLKRFGPEGQEANDRGEGRRDT